MSNIPSSAMPHAGTSTTTQTGRNDSGSASFRTGETDSQAGKAWSSDGTQTEQRSSFRETISDNKVTIAVAAAGAVAAAAIPFMLSKRKTSQRSEYPRSGFVETRERDTAL